MTTILYMVVWALWAGIGFQCRQDQFGVRSKNEIIQKPESQNKQAVVFHAFFFLYLLMVGAAPIVATFFVGRWLVWRWSEQGQHERKMRQTRRQNELKDMYDFDILESDESCPEQLED